MADWEKKSGSCLQNEAKKRLGDWKGGNPMIFLNLPTEKLGNDMKSFPARRPSVCDQALKMNIFPNKSSINAWHSLN
jgi:hypothetical protein